MRSIFFAFVIIFAAFAPVQGTEARPKTPAHLSFLWHYFDADRIENALKQHEKILKDGGWTKVAFVRKLEPGQSHAVVGDLRSRLVVSGDLKRKAVAGDLIYDDELVTAVKKFQRRHGLNEDGIVGQETLFELNVPVEERVRQLKLALERIRNLPLQEIARAAVVVNLPAFQMDVVEDNEVVLNMRVVVGQSSTRHHTPLLHSEINALVFHPTWHVPQSIALKEMLPKLKNDPDYLKRNNYKVIRSDENGTSEVDAAAVDWSATEEKNFPYSFHQRPGDDNALGTIKFIFPNKYSVYLHDTSSRSLFANNRRDLSHGCVRVEKPHDLARYLFSGDPDWPEEKINAAFKQRGERVVALKKKMPVYFIYHTAWVDPEGQVHFRRDIYGYDRRGEDLKGIFR